MRYASIVLLLVSTFVGKAVLQGCSLQIDKVNRNKMVLFVPNAFKFWPVNHDGHLLFRTGDLVELICAYKKNGLKIPEYKNFACHSGTDFKIGQTKIDLAEPLPYCTEPPLTSTTRKIATNFFEIGFLVKNTFIKQLEISLDVDHETTNYVKHTLRPGSCDSKCLAESRTFSESSRAFGMSGTQIDNLYNKISVYNEMSRRLGSTVSRYFDTGSTGRKHLQRGHLAPQADFIYLCEQTATFSYLNVAPQFQAFNIGNWKTAETNIRKYMKTQRLDFLEIYTGVAGVAELPNTGNIETQLYLQQKNTLRVPKFFFKVIIDPIRLAGVALIGVNNPYVNQGKIASYRICNQIIVTHAFLPAKMHDIASGYMYACEVLDFNSKIGNILPLSNRDVTSLLS